MLGISVYLGNQDYDMERWISETKKYKFHSIFTSLHIPEDHPSIYTERLKRLGLLAQKYEMQLFADVSPKSFSYLGINEPKELLDWGVTGIRLDYGYTDEEVVELSKQMKVGLNASTVNETTIQRWIQLGFNIENVEAWHNFYPRPETGLDDYFLAERNQMFKKYGIVTMAFIPGDNELRGPIYAGLPTLEKHRGMKPHIACAELLVKYHVDKVFIGDVSVKKDTLSLLSLLSEQIIPLKVTLNQDGERIRTLIAGIHTNRHDPARDVIRSQDSRHYAKSNGIKLKPSSTSDRPIGSVTVDNIQYGRYAGELQITKRNLPKDERVNVLGRIVEADIPLIHCIGPGQKFKLIVT